MNTAELDALADVVVARLGLTEELSPAAVGAALCDAV
jgi:hypothetical protein